MNRTKKKINRSPNPVISANLFSKWSFWWVRDLFKKGLHRPLKEEELYEYKPTLDSSKLTDKLSLLWEDELQRPKPSALRMLFRCYGNSFIIPGLAFCIVETITRILQPLCLGRLVSYFAENQTEISKDLAYVYAAGIVICSLVPVLTFHPFIFYIFEIGTKIRLSCAGLIYRKALRISKTATNEGLTGRAINILSNDLGKFDIALAFFHDLWKGPLETLLVGYFMYQEIGISAVIGVAFMLSFIPLQAWGAKKAAYYRQRTAERTDFRVKLMNEIIQGIQVIKMYAWEKSFATVIDKVRRKEINAIRGTVYIYAALQTTVMISKFSIFLSLVSYVYIGDLITAQKVFTVSSYFNILNDSMVHFWPLAITFCAEAYISAKRVTEFLLQNEGKVHPSTEIYSNTSSKALRVGHNAELKIELNNDLIEKPKAIPKRISNPNSKEKKIVLEKASAAWGIQMEENDNIAIDNFNLEITDASLTAVVGPVGAGKSTLLNVILGELELDSGRVEINGSLSYAPQEPWLFEGTIKDNIVFIEEFDSGRYRDVLHVCALEKDLELFPHGDSTIVGERGISLSGGQKARVSLARAVYRRADIYLLDDPLSAVDAHVGKHIFEKCIKEFLHGKIRILVTHQLQYLKDVEHLILINAGQIEAQGSYQTLQKSKEFTFLGQTHDEAGDDLEKQKEHLKRSESITDSPTEDMGDDRKELQAVGSVKFGVYKSYFKALGNCYVFMIIIFLFLVCRVMLTGVDYYISRWVIWEESIANEDSSVIAAARQNIVITYTIVLGLAFILYMTRTYGFFMMCLRISRRLHDQLFRGITCASMYFFNTNPSGRILNRFSKDIHSIDGILPEALIDCLSFFTEITAVLIVVAIANYYLLVPALIVSIFFYVLRYIYINTSRSVKRIDSMTRSPIYSHTNQTFQGLTTIRALNAQQQLEQEFHDHQNANTSAWFMYLATTRAFALWLDLVCVVYIGAVTFSFLALSDKFYSGDVGLAILQCINMIGMCQWGMRQTAELENQMTSVERVLEYAELPEEGALQTSPENRPNADWPSEGKVEFEHLSLKYSSDGEFVLNDLSFVIKPKEKIGIVGRTGAGKSSIIQSFFRLAINEGVIKIDGIDIAKLGLHDLRSNISIIPQDPVLFSGTLRYNLDPFETKKDDEMWKALEEVELKAHVSTLTGGLNCKMSDGGSNFSVGQRQLVCLARAILRNNKILILDEATANVDPETDKLIQKTIRTRFADCTVLTIAHRLHTIMDSDRVLVMDSGRAVEMAHPYELLQNPDGYLRKLVNQTGPATAAILDETALTSFQLKSFLQN